jgi:CRISPR system Cascade subunit CasB
MISAQPPAENADGPKGAGSKDEKPLDRTDTAIREFVGQLHQWASSERMDRATLAALRRGLDHAPGQLYPRAYPQMAPYVLPYTRNVSSEQEPWFFVVAALFALHPMHGNDARSLGASLRRVVGRTDDSLTARFQTLLASRRENLPLHLRQIVGLLAAKEIPINYAILLKDCLQWGDVSCLVPLRWARDYYYRSPANQSPKSETSGTASNSVKE